jgi:transmembrane sensor
MNMPAENPASNRMEDDAFAWATRLDGGLTPADRAELDAWLGQNPAHEWRLAHYRQFYAKIHGSVPVLAAEGRLAPVASAAAPRATRPASHRARLIAGGLAAAVTLSLGAVWFALRPETITTRAAHRQSVTFADGTHVDVNARTSLSVALRSAERRVRLAQGEACFEVTKDPSRPFFVETPSGTVRVTGTRFNVRADAPGVLEVTVLEGSVAVETSVANTATSPAHFDLAPRDQVSVAGGTAAKRKLAADATDNVVAWRDGKIVFDETPLRAALARFATYHDRQLSVDPAAADFPLGGRYTLDDLDEFIVSLERSLPLKAQRDANGAICLILLERSPARSAAGNR